jgi:hypothetical protein
MRYFYKTYLAYFLVMALGVILRTVVVSKLMH